MSALNALAAGAVVATLLSGCSSAMPGPDATTTKGPDPTTTSALSPAQDSPVEPVSEPAPTRDPALQLEQAVIDYTNAYFAGDWATAYERLWSARCKADNDVRNEFLGVLMAQKVNYPDGDRPQPGTVNVDRLQGDVAVVTYDYSYRGVTQVVTAQPWVYEDGAWHFDGC